jgi:hypothetical protein
VACGPEHAPRSCFAAQWRLGKEMLRMEAQMVFNKRGNEVIAVVVAGLDTQR